MRGCASRRTCGCNCCCLFFSNTTHKWSFRPKATHLAAGAEKSAYLPKLSHSPMQRRCSCLTVLPLPPQPESPPDAKSAPLSSVDATPPEYASGSCYHKQYKPQPSYSKPPSSYPPASRPIHRRSSPQTSRQTRSTAPAPATPPDRSLAPPSAIEPAHHPTQGSATRGNSRDTSPDADNKPRHPPAPTASSETPKTQTPSAATPLPPQSASRR